jgi:hypothetical protein
MNLTPTGFWIVVAILCCAALIVVTAEILRNHPEPAPDLEPARDVCDLESCDGRATVIYDARPFGEVLYICDRHADVVREWIGRTPEAPYDQENGVA